MDKMAMVLFTNNRGEVLLSLRDDDQWGLLEGFDLEGTGQSGSLVRGIIEEHGIGHDKFKFFNRYEHHEPNGTAREVFVFTCTINIHILKITLHEGQKISYFHPTELRTIKLPPIAQKVIADFMGSSLKTR